jgi:outer membrane protein
MRRTIAVICITLVCSAAPAQDVTAGKSDTLTLTLDRALALALERNRDMMIADQDLQKADAQIQEAWSGALPTVSLAGNYTRNIKLPVLFLPPNTAFNPSSQTQTLELGSTNAYVGSLTFAQTLFSWRVGTALDIAHTYKDYSQQSYKSTKDDVILSVKRAFYAVLFSQKLLEANRRGLDIVRANLDNVKAQFQNGTAAEFDQLRAEVQLANTEPLVTSAENSLLLSTNTLKMLLALPLDKQVVARGDFVYADVSADELARARENAIHSNPSIVALAFQESMLEKNIAIERAGYFPTLSLVGSYQIQAQDNTFTFGNYLWAKSFYLGLNLSLSVFDGFKTSARTQQASIDWQKIHLTRLKAEEGLGIAIQSTELTMAEAKKRIMAQQRSIDQARKAVSIAQTRYKSGVGTQLELLDAQVAMTRAETNYAQAVYDFLVARAQWANAVAMNE